jgi:pimeloyl-ACP methyl ester carboxylesterase
VTHLVLYGACTPHELEARRALVSLMRLGWGLNNPAFCKMFTCRFIPEATPEHEQWFDELQRVSTSPENAARLMERDDNIDVRPLLSQVKTPTLVIHCDRDRAVPPEEGRLLAAEIPGARYVSLPSASHLMLEEPAWSLFLEELGLFLNWLGGPRSRFSLCLLGVDAWVADWCRANRELATRVGLLDSTRTRPRPRP